jgi:hypothetical protein
MNPFRSSRKKSPARRPAAPRPAGFRPGCEALEVRAMPHTGAMDVLDYQSRWEFDADSISGSTAADTTGRNPATLVNAPAVIAGGQIHEGLSLSRASQQYVRADAVADDMAGRTSFSVSVWFKAAGTASTQEAVFAINGVNGENKLMLFLGKAGDATYNDKLSVFDGGAFKPVMGLPVGDDTWHQVTLVKSGTGANNTTVYVDGYKLYTYTSALTLAATDRWSFGQEWDSATAASDFLNGAVDDARVYARALSAADVDNIYRAGLPTPHSGTGDEGRQDEHLALFDLVRRSDATHVAVANGNWSSASTWHNGQVPTADARVAIAKGVTVTFDAAGTPALRTVRVDGTLTFRHDVNTRLLVETLAVDVTGTLNVGTAANPIQADKKAEILIDTTRGAITQAADPFLLGRGVISHGVTNIYGADKAAHVGLAADALAGASFIDLSAAALPAGWRVGDTLLLAGTYTDRSLTAAQFDAKDANNERFHDELLEVVSMTDLGSTVRVTFRNVTNAAAVAANRTTLLWSHTRQDGATFDPSELTIHVANLTRNVVVRSSDGAVPTQERGHFMVMHNPNAQVHNAQFKDLGRSDKRQVVDDPAVLGNRDGTAGTGTNPRGRYGLHLHRVGATSFAGTPAVVTGNVVWGTPGWGIVQHDSYAVVEDNVVFDVRGAGIVAEDGNELGTWRNNLVVKVTGDLVNDFDDTAALNGVRSNRFDFGFTGSGYWLQGGGAGVELIGNAAAGINGAGLDVFNRVDNGNSVIAYLDVTLIEDADLRAALQAAGYTRVRVDSLPSRRIDGLQVYNSFRGIHTWLQMRNSLQMEGTFSFDPSIAHRFRATVSDFTIWGVRSGVHNFYSSQMDFVGGLVVGDVASPVPVTRTNDSQFNNASGVGLSANLGDANSIGYDGVRVEGFAFGAHILAPDNPEVDYAVSSIANSRFANVGRAFASFTLGDRAFGTNFRLDEATTFSTLTAGNQLPTAAFTRTPVGGLSVRLDATGSRDPDPGPNVLDGSSGIAAVAWDLDNDGRYDDAFGQVITRAFAAGTRTVGLKVWDDNGATDTYTVTFTVSSAPYANAVADGDFAGTAAFGDTSYSIPSYRRDEGWIGHYFARSGSGGTGAAVATQNQYNTHGIAQVVHDQGVHRGVQTVSVRLRNTEAVGPANQVYVQVYGINGQFEGAADRTSTPAPIKAIPATITTLVNQNVGGTTFDWTTFSWNVDLGATGYEYLFVRVYSANVNVSGGDYLAVDDFSIRV